MLQAGIIIMYFIAGKAYPRARMWHRNGSGAPDMHSVRTKETECPFGPIYKQAITTLTACKLLGHEMGS